MIGHDRHQRHLFLQFEKLLEKSFLWIKRDCIAHRVSLIRPSDFFIVDFEGFVRSIDRNDIFARKITFSMVKIPFIPKEYSSRLPGKRTQGRERKYWLDSIYRR